LGRIRESLSAKLAVFLGTIILLGSGVFWYLSAKAGERSLMENTVAFASQLSDAVIRDIRHDMLTLSMDEIQRTLESVGGAGSIRRMRLMDGEGRVAYSSLKDEVGLTVDWGSPVCSGGHASAEPLEALGEGRRFTLSSEAPGRRVLSFVEPIYNEPDCSSAACHAHPRDRKVLGLLATDFSLEPIDARIRGQMADNAAYVAVFVVISAGLLYLLLWRLVLRPVRSLSRGMEAVASGSLSHKVDVPSGDEIGRLARTFNAMTGELSAARGKMETWTESLASEVEKKTREIKKAQDRLVEAEKLAALGRITSDIAHEIRNPLTSLGGFGRRLRDLASTEKQKEYADIIVSEVDRLERILRDVLAFSKDSKCRLVMQPVTGPVKAALSDFGRALEEGSVALETDFASEDPVLMDGEEVRRAVGNLLSNALDAMHGGGTLKVRTAREEANGITYVALHVSDTGEGIRDDSLPFIFEPFHTTKVVGRNTGLGLSISRKIMEEHGGFIRASNRPGGGTVASLYFPYQSDEERSRVPCWHYKRCGRNYGGLRCPAYPHFGRVCWVVAGTFCEGKVQGAFAQKCEDCQECDFYRGVTGGEL